MAERRGIREIIGGMVEIEIRGETVERFLNLCLDRGVQLGEVHWLDERRARARLCAEQVPLLREVARLSRCSFAVKRRFGLPFLLQFLRRRPVLPLLALVLIMAFAFIFSFIISVEVTSPYPLTAEQQALITDLAGEAGLQPGVSRWFIDRDTVEAHILDRERDLIFTEIRYRGIYCQVEVVYRINVPEENQPLPPGNLIAKCDGVVEDILVLQGTAAVAPGEAVRAGQVLVYGYQGKQAVAALALIRGIVWSSGYGEWPLSLLGIKETGNICRSLSLRAAGGAELFLQGGAQPPYRQYELVEQVQPLALWRNLRLPVEVYFREYRETVAYREDYSAAQAYQLAVAQAQAAALALLPEGAELLSSEASDISLDEQLKRAHVNLKASYDLSDYQELSEQELLALLPAAETPE